MQNRKAIVVINRNCGMHNDIRSQILGENHEEFEHVLLEWLKVTLASNFPVNVELLLEKAFQFSKKYDVKEFSASQEFIEKF